MYEPFNSGMNTKHICICFLGGFASSPGAVLHKSSAIWLIHKNICRNETTNKSWNNRLNLG